jgi:hypothetical protein
MKKKYSNDESHFGIRTVVFLCIVFGFILFNCFFINPNGRSCLGPPRVLIFGMVGFPLITLLLLLDLIVLAFLKALNWEKFLINLSLFLSMIFYFYLVF